jgi:hypothetical protein
MFIGVVVGYIGARQWFVTHYSEKMKKWSERMTKLSGQIEDIHDRYVKKESELNERYAKKEKELKEKYGEKD